MNVFAAFSLLYDGVNTLVVKFNFDEFLHSGY
jgi:hypothetical protein